MSIINNPTVALNAINAVYAMTGSRQQTADLIGVAGSTITRVLNRAGKPVRTPGRQNGQLTAGKLVAAYWQRGESLRTIASRVGVPYSRVRNTMIAYGIPLRSVN